jgi:hypothetical protein
MPHVLHAHTKHTTTHKRQRTKHLRKERGQRLFASTQPNIKQPYKNKSTKNQKRGKRNLSNAHNAEPEASRERQRQCGRLTSDTFDSAAAFWLDGQRDWRLTSDTFDSAAAFGG